MMPNRLTFVVSALATAAFVGVVAFGLATAGASAGATGADDSRAALMSVIEGFARETIPLD